MLPLPPKRFQQVDDPKYDPIRHYPWFRFLGERREKIAMLLCAYHEWKKAESIVKPITQQEAAELFGVDQRELRDYAAFVEGRVLDKPKNFQRILDEAYELYCGEGGKNGLRPCIETIAKLWGVNARHVIEAFEIDANFYPTGYRPSCPKCGQDYAMVKHQDGRWVCHKTHDL